DLAVHVGCPGERDKRQGRDHDCYRHCDEALHTFHSPFPWVLCGCDRPASTHVAARVTPDVSRKPRATPSTMRTYVVFADPDSGGTQRDTAKCSTTPQELH